MTRSVKKEWIGKNDDCSPTPKVKGRVYDRQEGKCAICGLECKRGLRPAYDHIKALGKGGENRESNLQLLCVPCHAVKTWDDIKEMSMVARKRNKHLGIATKTKRQIGSRGFQRTRPQRTASRPIEDTEELLAEMVQCPKCGWWTNAPKSHDASCPADRPYPLPDRKDAEIARLRSIIHAQCALTDDQQYALERMAGHDLQSSGLTWDNDRLLIQSAAQAAKDVLSAFTSTEREMTPTEKQLVEKALRDSGKTIETLTPTKCDHPRKLGGGSVGADGWSSHWTCQDCGASESQGSAPAVTRPSGDGK